MENQWPVVERGPDCDNRHTRKVTMWRTDVGEKGETIEKFQLQNKEDKTKKRVYLSGRQDTECTKIALKSYQRES